MYQEAILMTENNLDLIADSLNEMYTTEHLLEDYGYMLKYHENVILCIDVRGDFRSVSYVVTKSSFDANAIAEGLNEETFTKVTQI